MRSCLSFSNCGGTVLCAMVFTFAFDASAMEKMNANTLIQVCKDFHTETKESLQGNLCHAYLQGFVAGSHTIMIETDQQSDFMQRALRTRAPGDCVKPATYCLSTVISLSDFSAKIADLEDTYTQDAGAETVILQVLDSHYRCER